jgi:carbonic anhydrase/acetyltransferase-like protein (isoleucine patch superfamily)
MTSDKKYTLIKCDRKGLFQIKALRDFSDVKKGDVGGYVSGECNLSHYGDCWIYNKAVVRDNAVVSCNARLFNYAEVSGNARVFDNAEVSGNAKVFGNAMVYDNAVVGGHAKVSENAEVCGNAIVSGCAEVMGKANVYGNAEVNDCAKVFGNTNVHGNAVIRGDASVSSFAVVLSDAVINGNAIVRGNVTIDGVAFITGNAVVESIGDYFVFKNTWSSGRYFTWTRSNNMWKVGCFYGSGEELIKKAYSDDKLKGKMYEIYVNLVNELLKAEK